MRANEGIKIDTSMLQLMRITYNAFENLKNLNLNQNHPHFAHAIFQLASPPTPPVFVEIGRAANTQSKL